MYGLLLQTIYDYLLKEHGEDVLRQVRSKANVPQQSFVPTKVYSETIIPRLARAAAEVCGASTDDLMSDFGKSFVQALGKYGYDRILNVLGRDMRDFLSGLDNLHEYMKFSYPSLKPPSFAIEDETVDGLVLHYRSKRKRFLQYVIGQIKEVGKLFYNDDVEIEVIKEEDLGATLHVVMRLFFDNKGFKKKATQKTNIESHLRTLPCSTFFKMFPFHILFDRQLIIQSVGDSLTAVFSDIRGQQLDDVFTMNRPLLEFTWDNINAHQNNTFEFTSLESVSTNSTVDDDATDSESLPMGTDFETMSTSTSVITKSHDNMLHLRGQIIYVDDWDTSLFLGTPVLNTVTDMARIGLFVNDFSICDSTRDLIMAGTQQSVELKLALDQEQQKSKKLEESVKKLDQYKRHTDALLYQMIPQAVADRLRHGESAVQTCEVFKMVTVMFSDVVGFDDICSKISPMEVVSMLNAMYTKFDKLSERHHVYKVETVADSYMVVSGAPLRNNSHAQCCAEMALDMIAIAPTLREPSSSGFMNIRCGMHSGPVVAGVVGLKMPRYCLFGDTVNTASRMESTGEGMKIHISNSTEQLLNSDSKYTTTHRGSVEVKGKGEMKTFWLTSTSERPIPVLDEMPVHGAFFIQDDLMQDGRDSPTHSVYTPVTYDEINHSEKQITTEAMIELNHGTNAVFSSSYGKVGECLTANRLNFSKSTKFETQKGGIGLMGRGVTKELWTSQRTTTQSLLRAHIDEII